MKLFILYYLLKLVSLLVVRLRLISVSSHISDGPRISTLHSGREARMLSSVDLLPDHLKLLS